MSGRGIFVAISAALLALVLFTAVVRPAVERGGYTELAVVAGAFALILIVERWLRTR